MAEEKKVLPQSMSRVLGAPEGVWSWKMAPVLRRVVLGFGEQQVGQGVVCRCGEVRQETAGTAPEVPVPMKMREVGWVVVCAMVGEVQSVYGKRRRWL